MKRVESGHMNFSCTHQCLIFRELIATHAEHSPIFQNWRCSVSEYTDHNRFHWYMTKHLCRPQFVFKTKKSTKETFEERYIWLVKTYFWVLRMSSILYLRNCTSRVLVRALCIKQKKSFVPQLKSTICFHFKATNIKCEGWGLITVMKFPTKMISVPANKGFYRPQIWMHCMFWFLSMLTWSWTWTNEDLWGLWSCSTHTWIFSLRHQQMLVVVAKYHDLEQATPPRSFLSSSNPMGCWTTRGERQWSLSIKLHCSKINISWF